MSEISETQRNLNKLMNDYEAAVIGENRGRNLPGYSEKVDKYYQKRRELKEFVAELEHDLSNKEIEYTDLWDDMLEMQSRIAEFEAAQRWIPVPQSPEVQESEATACKFCGSNESDRRMNSIVCSGCGRKIGNVAPPEVQE